MAPSASRDSWWVLIPQSDEGESTAQLDKVDFRLQFAPSTPEYTDLMQRKPIQYGPGLTLVYWKGPFASETQAKKEQSPKASPNPIASAASGVEKMYDFFGALDQSATWLRVGEFVIGGIVMAIALKSMFPSQVQAVTGAAKSTVKRTAEVAAVAAA
jgi:hypothetical protein